MAHRIVLLGAPGAGKGTQARRMATKYGLPHVSTGDIFRLHVENRTELGRKIEDYMKNGTLVPDRLACEIMADRLGEEDCRTGYILDGFPRSVPQAEELDALLSDRGEDLNVAIEIAVSDDELVERLTSRRVCPNCGKIYNLRFKPPKVDGVCDKPVCRGEKLIQREDDTERTIRQRLKVYHKTTEPILGHFEAKGLLRKVGGAYQDPDAITASIDRIVNEISTR